MIEISKKFFSKIDREEESKHVEADLYSEQACKRVASIYSRFAEKWSGHDVYFLTSRMGRTKREKRIEQIKKLITIVSDLGVPVEVYIETQFDEQMPFLKTRGLTAVPFANLISVKAIKRFKDSNAGKADFSSALFMDVRKIIEDSADKMCNRLRVLLELDSLDEQAAIKEAEVMVRSGVISNIYIFTSPLALCGKSQYLDEQWMVADKKLNKFEKKEAMRVRTEFLKKVGDKRIAKYV